MITTIHGPMPEEALVKSEGTDENENEIVNWVEYRLERAGEFVLMCPTQPRNV